MSEELFDDKTEDLAMRVIEEGEGRTYVSVQRQFITFKCTSLAHQAFIIQKVPNSSTQLHDLILPYQSIDVKELQFKFESDINRAHTNCSLCNGSDPNAEYSQTKANLKHTLHKSCAEQYNSALDELDQKLQPHHQEILAELTAREI